MSPQDACVFLRSAMAWGGGGGGSAGKEKKGFLFRGHALENFSVKTKIGKHLPVFEQLSRRCGCLYLFWDIFSGLPVVQDRRVLDKVLKASHPYLSSFCSCRENQGEAKSAFRPPPMVRGLTRDPMGGGGQRAPTWGFL